MISSLMILSLGFSQSQRNGSLEFTPDSDSFCLRDETRACEGPESGAPEPVSEPKAGLPPAQTLVFEELPTPESGWLVSENATVTLADANTAIIDLPGTHATDIRKRVALRPGVRYRLEVELRLPQGDDGSERLRLSNSGAHEGGGSWLEPTEGWQTQTFEFVSQGEETLFFQNYRGRSVDAEMRPVRLYELKTTLEGVAPSASEVSGFWGVNTHVHYLDTRYGDWDKVVKAIEDLGVKHVRDAAFTYPGTGPDHWVYQKYCALAPYADLTLILDPPDLVGKDGTEPALVDDLKAWTCGALEAVSGPNEVDASGDPAWVAKTRAYQCELFDAAKRAGLAVVAPTVIWSTDALGDLSACATYGDMHPYPGGRKPTHNLDANLRSHPKITGNTLPMIVTETGYHNAWRSRDNQSSGGHPGVTEEAAATYLPRLGMDYLKRGIERAYVYELLDPFFGDRDGDGLRDHTDRDKHFGLIGYGDDKGWRYKAQFYALQNIIRLYSQGGHPALCAVAVDIEASLACHASGDALLVALWRDVPYGAAPVPAMVYLSLDYEAVACTVTEVLDCGGPVVADRLSLEVGDALTVITLR